MNIVHLKIGLEGWGIYGTDVIEYLVRRLYPNVKIEYKNDSNCHFIIVSLDRDISKINIEAVEVDHKLNESDVLIPINYKIRDFRSDNRKFCKHQDIKSSICSSSKITDQIQNVHSDI